MLKRFFVGIVTWTLLLGCFAVPAAADTAALMTTITSEAESPLPFTDVTENDWFYESVSYNYSGKLMTGMDATHFGPYDTLSRAQFAVILHRMNGEPAVEYTGRFPDVPAGTWYTDAILWAADTGVVTGYANTGMFGPADMITREQMAVMMYRYGNYQGYDTSEKAAFDQFLDASSVSPFANDAMAWAVGNGIITGKSEGTMLDPQGNAARAECAAIIMRFMNQYGEIELNLSEDMVVLMDNYMQNAEITWYGGLTVTEITVHVMEDGILNIGTVKVADALHARRYAMDCAVDMTEYEVQEGTNTITLQLEVAEDETIVLGGNGSVSICSKPEVEGDSSIFTILDGESHRDIISETDGVSDELDVQVMIEDLDEEKHLADLQKKDALALKEHQRDDLISYVAELNFSILADSISTYPGYSNDAINTNNTIGNNAVWYNSSILSSVEDTWWMQLVDQTEMNLLVNNSWSGSRVLYSDLSAGYNTRPVNLHDNTGADAGTTPDIVAIFMGINDFDFYVPLGTYSEDLYDTLITYNANGTISYKTPTTFTEAYIIMMDKIMNEYEDVDIFCFTLLPNSVNTDYAGLREYNETIRAIAEYYDAGIVDLYNDSGITASNFRTYTVDGLHPNATGMDMITDTFIDAMIEKYVE